MGSEDGVGRRIARARKLQGLTQTGLAGRAHLSKSLIAQVESGHKPATPSLIAAVATALGVDVTDLTGQPYRGASARSDRVHASIPLIRQALVYWDIPPILDVPPRPLPDLAEETGQVSRLRRQASYAELGPLLPTLISELTVHAHQARGAGRTAVYIDLSRAWLWQRDHAKALACVVKAEQLAPQRTRYHPMARETVTRLLDAQRRTPEPLRGIAARMGLS